MTPLTTKRGKNDRKTSKTKDKNILLKTQQKISGQKKSRNRTRKSLQNRQVLMDQKSPWAIRDIKHGKTFHFNSFEEMKKFVTKGEKNEISNATLIRAGSKS